MGGAIGRNEMSGKETDEGKFSSSADVLANQGWDDIEEYVS